MGQRDRLFSILSLVMLAMTAITLGYYILIAINPYLSINPFPPSRQQQVIMATPTPTPTATRELAATWTPTLTPTVTPTWPPRPPTFTPTITPTPGPTSTPVPTATETPTITPTPRVTRSPYPFTYEIAYETPFYGCAWSGVAGTVEDLDGNPLIGYPIHVWGGGLDLVITSGSAPLYGASGWEQFFNDHPIAIEGEFKVQLHARDDPNHPPVSEEIVLNFPGYCSRAMARIVFIKNH